MSWTAGIPVGTLKVHGCMPEKVLVVNDRDEHRTYVPERMATIVKVPRQSHVALGHYECGGCGATIDAGDNFCRRCGAKLEGADE